LLVAANPQFRTPCGIASPLYRPFCRYLATKDTGSSLQIGYKFTQISFAAKKILHRSNHRFVMKSLAIGLEAV
jgi:hypothetical protein